MAKKQEEINWEWDQIEIGDQVKHPKWGVGTVLFRSGVGPNAKAIVVFPEEGQKKLLLRYAKLQKVGTTSLKSVEKLKAETPRPKPRKPAEIEEEEELPLPLDEVAAEEEDEIEFDEEDEVVGFDEDEEADIKSRDGGDEEKA
jgi:hypothetical protein